MTAIPPERNAVTVMSLYFYLSRKRRNPKGMCPVYCRISGCGPTKRKDFSTGIFLDPKGWGDGWPIKNTAQCINRLATVSEKVYAIISDCERHLIFDEREVVKRYLGKQLVPNNDVLSIAGELIQEESPSVLSAEKISRVAKQFVEMTGCKEVSAITPEALKGFVNRMKAINPKTQQPFFAATTIQKKMEFFKRVLVYAENKEYVRKNPFRFYKVPRAPDVEPEHHTVMEQQLLLKHKFVSDRLGYVRDLYLFSCNSGLSYGDLFVFSQANVVEDNGRKYVTGRRYKFPHEEYYLPLLSLAEAIAEKYDYCFRPISNQKYNSYIKECCEIVGIANAEDVSSKIARKTFSQNMIDAGYSNEVVAKMMGHKHFKMTRKHYGRISRKRVQVEALRIAG